MKIKSSAFDPNQKIPAKYTCDGENINPPLIFKDIPAEAKSLVLIVDDPDAPKGIWLHWTCWNINSKTKEVIENSVPRSSVQGLTDFGNIGYGGPCPPSGSHRYFFKIYALDKVLDLPEGATHWALEKAMEGHIIDKAELVGIYPKD